MSRLTDQELIDELKVRFETNRKALFDLQSVTAQLEKMNRKLQESEAMKSHFLSNIRNEINNPLTSILGLSRHLMGGKCDPQKAVEVAGLIYAEAFDLDFQLRNIFVAAELESGECTPEFAHVDVGSLVASTIEMLVHHSIQKGIRIQQVNEGFDGATDFVTDAQMLQVMMINLLMNAIEYSPPAGEVQVVLARRPDALKIVVRDSGSGIDPACHTTIFDRFRQLESGSTKGHRGHGLGLSITKALIELLSGKVSVHSAVGDGAEFTLTLPVPEADTPVTLRAQDGNFFLFEDDDEGSAQLF